MKKTISILILLIAVKFLSAQTSVSLELPNPCSNLSIEQNQFMQNENLSVTVLPNPNTGQFELEINSKVELGRFEISIVNASGQLLYQEKFFSESKKCVKAFDFKDLQPGVYSVSLSTEVGRVSTKIVISKN